MSRRKLASLNDKCVYLNTSFPVLPATLSLSDPTWSPSKLECFELSLGDSQVELCLQHFLLELDSGWLCFGLGDSMGVAQHQRCSLEFKLMQNIWAGTNRKEKWKQVVIFHSVGVHFSSHGACPWEQNISNVKSKNIFVVMLGIENNAKTLPSWVKYFAGRL